MRKKNAKSWKEKDLCQTTKSIWRFFGKIDHLWTNKGCRKRTKSIRFIISDKLIRFQFNDVIVGWFTAITPVTTIIGNVIISTIDCINQSGKTICNCRKCKLRGRYNLNLNRNRFDTGPKIGPKNWSEKMARKIKQAAKEMKSSTKFFKKNFFNLTFTSFWMFETRWPDRRPAGLIHWSCWPWRAERGWRDPSSKKTYCIDIIYL